jgi:hypothetical protein
VLLPRRQRENGREKHEDPARQAANKEPRRREEKTRSGGSKMCGAKMGETPERMTGFSVIYNEFPSLLSSLLRCFAALYPFGTNCLTGKFAQRAQISTDCGTKKRVRIITQFNDQSIAANNHSCICFLFVCFARLSPQFSSYSHPRYPVRRLTRCLLWNERCPPRNDLFFGNLP